MVLSNASKKNAESTSRKLFEFDRHNSDAISRLSEQLLLHATNGRLVRRPSVAVKPSVYYGNGNRDRCPTPSCIGKGVADILARRPKLFTFKEACAILAHCDLISDRTFIEDTVRKYSIVIIGLSDCAEEDLILAAYFFIEDMFGIKPKIEMCVKIIDEFEKDSIGVVFENVTTKEKIASKLRILNDSGIEIDTYFDINWILKELCNE